MATKEKATATKQEMETKSTEVGIELQKRNVTQRVMDKITELSNNHDITIPADYSPENALNAAWLVLQKTETKSKEPVLRVCTSLSIANALIDMVVQGLTPAKNQCYFIPYGEELTLMRSYMGAIAVAKRFADIKAVNAQCVYQNDTFEYKLEPDGHIEVTQHIQSLANIDIHKIVAAYAVVIGNDGSIISTEIMTMTQLRAAWGQGYGKSAVHEKFTEEMAKKSVINRACKTIINSSSDESVLADTYKRTVENDYKQAEADDSKQKERAAAAIFGAPEPNIVDAEPIEDAAEPIPGQQTMGLSDEEKAQIEAEEKAQAEQYAMEQAELRAADAKKEAEQK
ncbi:MAG: RecT family recombinase [Eubacteriaceae bacterium]|nr:RecT family recombinase [Eubacteriaceae bacterium]